MDRDRIVFDVFMVAGLVLIFVVAVGIFLNVLGYALLGGEVKKGADIAVCKQAIASCVNSQIFGNTDCSQTCLCCIGNLYEKCLKGDLSLFSR